jgi:hypothetical protein
MAISLPGPGMGPPDQPPRRVLVTRPKKKRPKPRAVGTVGPPRPKPPKPKPYVAPTPTPAPVGKYDAYKGIPGAVANLNQLDMAQQQHQNYVTEKVAPWLKDSLLGLQGYQDAAQTGYQQQITGAGVGGLNVAAGMTPLGTGATAGGGIIAGNNQYLAQGASLSAGGAASSLLQESANRARMNKLSPIPISQAAIQAVADYAKQLPAQYVQKRLDYTTKLDEFIAKAQSDAAAAAETAYHNRVMESIGAQNAQTNAAIQLGKLGLSSTKEANDQATQLAASSQTAPYGYVVDAKGNLHRDPSVPQATNPSTAKPAGTYTVNQLKKEGFAPLSKKAGAKWKQRATVADDGSLWIKAGSSSGNKPTAAQVKAAAGSKPFDVQKALQEAFDGGAIDNSNQNTGTGDLLRFLRKYQPTDKKNFASWWKQTLPVLARIDPSFASWMAGYRARRVQDGTWKGQF